MISRTPREDALLRVWSGESLAGGKIQFLSPKEGSPTIKVYEKEYKAYSSHECAVFQWQVGFCIMIAIPLAAFASLAHGCARVQALAVPRLQASAKSALAASMSPFIL